MSIGKVLSSILHENVNYCCLCFQEIKENTVWIDDEICIDSQDTQTMSELINLTLGEDVLDSVSIFGIFCDCCKVSVVNSYKFKKTCKENLQNLTSVITSVTESFDNMLPDLENYNTLFVAVDLHDFTTKQFYNDVNFVSLSKAYKKFCSLVNPKFKTNADLQEHSFKVKNINEIIHYEKKRKRNEERRLKTLAIVESDSIHSKPNKERKLYDIPSVPVGHIMTEDSEISNYKCRICLIKFTEENKLRHHFFKKHYERCLKCPKCPRKFITSDMLKQHEQEYHKAQVCSECGKLFTSKYTLHKHELHHNFQITCDECGRVYRSTEAFKKHITDDVCRQKSRKTADQANFQCDHCNKRYCYKPYLAKHIMFEHGDAEGFRCKFCKKQFYTQSRLKTHLVKHTREKNFICTICEGRFVTKESLVYHTRLHTGEKPYQCEHCDKAFLSASRRLDHVRRHHLAPSLECDICHTKFKATGSLLKHRKRHLNPNSKLNSTRHTYTTASADSLITSHEVVTVTGL